MSKVYKELNSNSHIVEAENGKLYYVDSADTFDRGPETMVFYVEEQPDGKFSVNWMDLYAELHYNMTEAAIRHMDIINNLEKYLEG